MEVLMSAAALSAPARGTFVSAMLVESHEYSSCDYLCAPFNNPTTAYCIQVGNDVLVGHRGTILGEDDRPSMRDLAGKEVTVRFNEQSIWIKRGDRGPLKIARGSTSEHFKTLPCIREVHREKLALAANLQRPDNVPPPAVLLPDKQSTAHPLFLWLDCAMSPDQETINCRKWSQKGESYGIDRYCARTTEGTPVSQDFEIDQIASREQMLVLKSGAALQPDHRGRTNDILDHPGESCH